ncbi:MAG: hypothetical protein MHM6MM_000742 [Cercozoa sp. M6MM]
MPRRGEKRTRAAAAGLNVSGLSSLRTTVTPSDGATAGNNDARPVERSASEQRNEPHSKRARKTKSTDTGSSSAMNDLADDAVDAVLLAHLRRLDSLGSEWARHDSSMQALLSANQKLRAAVDTATTEKATAARSDMERRAQQAQTLVKRYRDDARRFEQLSLRPTASLQEKVAAMEAELSVVRQESDAMRRVTHQQQRRLQELHGADDRCASLQQQLQDANAQLRSLTHSLERTQRELDESRVSEAETRRKHRADAEQLLELRQVARTQEKDLRTVRQQLQKAQEDNEALKRRRGTLVTQVTELSDDRQFLKQTLQLLLRLTGMRVKEKNSVFSCYCGDYSDRQLEETLETEMKRSRERISNGTAGASSESDEQEEAHFELRARGSDIEYRPRRMRRIPTSVSWLNERIMFPANEAPLFLRHVVSTVFAPSDDTHSNENATTGHNTGRSNKHLVSPTPEVLARSQRRLSAPSTASFSRAYPRHRMPALTPANRASTLHNNGQHNNDNNREQRQRRDDAHSVGGPLQSQAAYNQGQAHDTRDADTDRRRRSFRPLSSPFLSTPAILCDLILESIQMVAPIKESVGLLWGVTPPQLRLLQQAKLGQIGLFLKGANGSRTRSRLQRILNEAAIDRLAKLAQTFLDGEIEASVTRLREDACAKFKQYLTEYDKKSNRRKRLRGENAAPLALKRQELLEARVKGVPQVLSQPPTGQELSGVSMRKELGAMGLKCSSSARVSSIRMQYQRVHRLNPYLAYPDLMSLVVPLAWRPNDEDTELECTEGTLMGLQKEELVQLCQQRDLATNGTKRTLAARILEACASDTEARKRKISCAVSLDEPVSSKHGAKLASDMIVRTEDNDAFAAEDARHMVQGEQVLMQVQDLQRPDSLIPEYDMVDQRFYNRWCRGSSHSANCASAFFLKKVDPESASATKEFWRELNELVLKDSKSSTELPPADQWLVLSDRLDLTDAEFRELGIDCKNAPWMWKVGKFSAATIAGDFIYELFPSVPCEVIGRIAEFFDAIKRDESDFANAVTQNSHLMDLDEQTELPSLEYDTLARYSVLVNAREMVRRVRASAANSEGWCQLRQSVPLLATLMRLWQRQESCSFLAKTAYLDQVARAEPQSLAPDPVKVAQRIRQSDALLTRLENQTKEDDNDDEFEQEKEIVSLLRRQTSLFATAVEQREETFASASSDVETESELMETRKFEQLLAQLSNLKSKVLLKQSNTTPNKDETEHTKLTKLASGVAPYEYQKEYLRWAFGIERQVSQGKSAGGKGMQLNLGLADLEWRGTGLCHEYHSERDGNGRLVQFPLLIDFTHGRLCVRPSNFDEFAARVAEKKLRTFSAAGGVLSDEVGLGKSFSMICLSTMNRRVMPTIRVSPAEVGVPRVKLPKRKRAKNAAESAVKEVVLEPSSDGKMLVKQLRIEKGHVVTGATLIMAPNHLVGQWQSEVTKMTRVPQSKVIVLSTKSQHESVNVYDLVQAEFVIVSYNFLGGKYYTNKYGVDGLAEYDPESKTLESPWTRAPSLAAFDWHRIVIDEAHELFQPFTMRTEPKFLHLKSARTRAWGYTTTKGCKWALSATPFVDATNGSLYGYFKYLDMRLNGTPMVQLGWLRKNSKPMRYQKLLAGSIEIRSYGDPPSKKADFLASARTNWPAHLFERALLRRQTRKSIGFEDETPPFEEEVHEIDCLAPEQILHDTCTSTQEKVQAMSMPQLLLRRQFGRRETSTFVQLDDVLRRRVDAIEEKIDAIVLQIYELKLEINTLSDLLKTWREHKNRGNPACRLVGRQYLGFLRHMTLASMESELNLRKFQLTHQISKCDAEQTALSKLREYVLNQLANDMPERKAIRDEKDLNDNETFTRLRVLAGSKLAHTARYIQRLLKESDDACIVIFSAYDLTLQLVVSLLDEYGIHCVMCRGNVWQRRKALATFSKEGGPKKTAARVLAMSLKSTASGTNLLNSTHVFLLDALVGTREQVRAQEMQAVGRGSRQGMEHPVKVVRMLVRGSKEHDLWEEYHDEETSSRGLAKRRP